MKRIITITGPSGAGKDTVARMMSEMTDWPVLCSYTTRPMREGEVDGREHYFVERFDVPFTKILAYTHYGGYDYWTSIDQVKDTAIYVIDEVGLVELKEKHPEIDVYSVYVNSLIPIRLERGVKLPRIIRDVERFRNAPQVKYDFAIHNNKDKNTLQEYVARCICFIPFVKDMISSIYQENDEDGFSEWLYLKPFNNMTNE